MGAYSVERADMPRVKAEMERGSWTLAKRSVFPLVERSQLGVDVHGSGSELHCYTEWGSQTPEFPSRLIGDNGIFPTVFPDRTLGRCHRPRSDAFMSGTA